MDLALTTSLTALSSAEHALESTAQNLANANTAGYQPSHAYFESFMDVTQTDSRGNSSTMPWGVQAYSSSASGEAGPQQYTGISTDLALDSSHAYFVVQTPQGERYTRAGSFHYDGKGRLVNSEGLSVLGDKGAIVAPHGRAEITSDGTVQDADGSSVGHLKIVSLKGQELSAAGQGLYRLARTEGQATASKAQVMVGQITGSATNAFAELSDMVGLMRMAESAQKAVATADNINGQAVQIMRL